MYFFDPHVHLAARTTDDLAAMARAGCVAAGEPAFWMGYDRTAVGSFYDYFRQLTEWEPNLRGRLRHSPLCLVGRQCQRSRERRLRREVIAVLPEFLDKPDVLGIGEIGFHKCTKNEVATLLALIDLGMHAAMSNSFFTRRTWKISTRARG